MGPSLEYAEYDDYLHLRKQYANIPSRLPKMTMSLVYAVVHLAIYLVFFVGYFHVDFMWTKDFLRMSGWKCVGYAIGAVTFVRFKYYFAFKMCSCSLDATGITFSGYKQPHIDEDSPKAAYDVAAVPTWDLIPTCLPFEFETATSMRDKVRTWNMSVQSWLSRCVYHRYRTSVEYRKDKEAQARGQLLVFMVSAFWHGFYFGYYLSFFCVYCILQISASVFRIGQIRPDLMQAYKNTKWIGPTVFAVLTSAAFSFYGCYFHLMLMSNCLALMTKLWFLPEILLLGLMVMLQKVASQRPKKKESDSQNVREEKPKGEAVKQ